MKTKRRLVSLFLTVCMVLSAIPFAGVTQVYAAENPAIAATLKTADNVLAYAGTDIGDGTYQFKQDKYAALQTARASANALIESADEAAVIAATAAVNTAVTELLGSNKLPDEPLFGYAPQSLMTATADSWHSSNPPQNTVDGNIRTIWHSKYNNGVDERPHILTVDLGRKQLIHSVYVESRTDRPMSGNIRTGRVYAGDTLEAVTSDEQKEGNLVMTFDTGALPNGTPVTLEIPYVYAKVLSVEVDTTNDAHTAIAEFNVNTYDRALSKFAAPYLAAAAFADAAVVGTEYSNYSQESLTAFENRLAEIYATFTNPATKLSDIPTLIPLVEEAQAAFYATMVSYTKADLLALINLATEEANGLAAGAIRAALEGNINSARAVSMTIPTA